MKNKYFIKKAIILTLILSMGLFKCSEDFLEQSPNGSVSQNTLANLKGADALLIGAYSMLDGFAGGVVGDIQSPADNWIYGSIAGGDAHKGSDAGDQQLILTIESYANIASNDYFNIKWRVVYEGVSRANAVLRILPDVKDATDEQVTTIAAEARFLRAHYHFEAKKMWNNVPYVDETVITDFKVPNDKDIWPMIEADFKFAYDNLDDSGMKVGRANKWAAAAFLVKSYMFQKKYTEAKGLLDEIIAEGVSQLGVKYDLTDNYHDNFNADTKNNAETVFGVQFSVNDGSNGDNGNFGDFLNFPHNNGAIGPVPGGCCGFFQPSQEFVNSFRTDAGGLPILDGSYNAPPNAVKNDQGVEATSTFVPDAGNLDPRLDWTVGRRGIPFLDWGLHPGKSWIRDQTFSGPYSPIKHIYHQSQQGIFSDVSFWIPNATSVNYNLIRYADVLLWAAECEVEVGALEKAREYVNMIRSRAANPGGFVKLDNGDPAANYVISTYTTPWTDKDTARKAVHFERKLEFGMEGHRFFDLVRWDEATQALSAYLTYESNLRTYLAGAVFNAGIDEYYPIPQAQIDLQGPDVLKQNPQ